MPPRMQLLAATDGQPFMAVLGFPSQPRLDTTPSSPLVSMLEPTTPIDTAGFEPTTPIDPLETSTPPSPFPRASDTVRDSEDSPLSWDSPLQSQPVLAARLQAQFDATLSSTLEYASAALRIVAPELQVCVFYSMCQCDFL